MLFVFLLTMAFIQVLIISIFGNVGLWSIAVSFGITLGIFIINAIMWSEMTEEERLQEIEELNKRKRHKDNSFDEDMLDYFIWEQFNDKNKK